MAYGLCCKTLNTVFKKKTWAAFSREYKTSTAAIENLQRLWADNLRTTIRLYKLCWSRGWTYRMSSSLLPLATHPLMPYEWAKHPLAPELVAKEIKNCRALVSSLGVRASMHPDQFNVLASTNLQAIEKTIIELSLQGQLMSAIGLPESYESPINLHLNNSTDSPTIVQKRFWATFGRLPECVQKRLVLENEDKGNWTVHNLRKYFPTIPTTFDNLHHKCNPGGSLSVKEAAEICALSWPTKPLFHYSESMKGDKNPRKHGDVPFGKPPKLSCDVDWEVELKTKDVAIEILEGVKPTVD